MTTKRLDFKCSNCNEILFELEISIDMVTDSSGFLTPEIKHCLIPVKSEVEGSSDSDLISINTCNNCRRIP